MKIKEQLYQVLSPTQRVVAIFAAIDRDDAIEGSRLLSQAPRGEGHGKAFLGMCQALNVYNFYMSRVTRDILFQTQKITAAEAYCTGWLDAGGAPDNAGYLKRYSALSQLLEGAVLMNGELEAVKQAAREWCENNSIPIEIFAGKLAFMPLTSKSDLEVPVDDALLEQMRSLFHN